MEIGFGTVESYPGITVFQPVILQRVGLRGGWHLLPGGRNIIPTRVPGRTDLTRYTRDPRG